MFALIEDLFNQKNSNMARNTEINAKMKESRRKKILAASLILFAKKGLSGTKITDIAQKSGMSQGLVYHYYSSKEEIYIELVKRAFSELIKATTELENFEQSTDEKITMALKVLINDIQKSKTHAYYHLLITQAMTMENVPKEVKNIIQTDSRLPYTIMARIFKKGQTEKTIKNYNADDMALLFWVTIKGLSLNKVAYGKNFKAPDIAIIKNMFITEK